jgi:hypothetical protein
MKEARILNETKKLYVNRLYQNIVKLFDDIREKNIDEFGFYLPDIARIIMKKQSVSQKDIRLTYSLIRRYKLINANMVICKNRKYGFPQTKEECTLYAIDLISSAAGKLISVRKNLDSNGERLGISFNSRKLISSHIDDVMR